jgi:lipopolysaccharide export system permease protein
VSWTATLIDRGLVPGRLGRHVLNEFLRSLGLATCVFVGFFMLMSSLKFESEAEAYGTNVATMVRALPFLLPYLLLFAIPMAFLVAGVLTFGRLEGAGEIGAMRAAGVRLSTVVGPPLAVALVASFGMIFICDTGIEWGFSNVRSIVVSSGRASLMHKADTGKTLCVDSGKRSYRIHRFGGDAGGASPIAIVEFRDGAPEEVVLARDHELEIGGSEVPGEEDLDCFRFRLEGHESAPDGKGWARVFRPGEVVLAKRGRLELAFRNASAGKREVGTREYESGLSANIRRARQARDELTALRNDLASVDPSGHGRAAKPMQKKLDEAVSTRRVYEMEIHRKISMAFGPIAMLLFGIPMGLRLGRGSRVAGFTIGIAAIAVVYYPLWISGQGLAVSGALPPGPAVWAAPALVGTGGAAWLSRIL